MSKRTTFLNEELYQYLLQNSLREHPILAELRKVTAGLSTSTMQIAPEQGQFMRLLVQLLGAKKTLEIGVYTGYSAMSVALALPEEGKVIACDINKEWTELAREYWEKAGISHKIELTLGPAAETLAKLIEQGFTNHFDFAFIDADKTNYHIYYEQCLQLIRKGGLIAIDNVLWDGAVIDGNDYSAATQAIREINAKLVMDDRVFLSMVPIGDGLTLALKC